MCKHDNYLSSLTRLVWVISAFYAKWFAKVIVFTLISKSQVDPNTRVTEKSASATCKKIHMSDYGLKIFLKSHRTKKFTSIDNNFVLIAQG